MCVCVWGGGGEDFLEKSLIWMGYNKMFLGLKNLKKCNLNPVQLSTEEY